MKLAHGYLPGHIEYKMVTLGHHNNIYEGPVKWKATKFTYKNIQMDNYTIDVGEYIWIIPMS